MSVETFTATRVACSVCPAPRNPMDREPHRGPGASDEPGAVKLAGDLGWIRIQPYAGSTALDFCPSCWAQVRRDMIRNGLVAEPIRAAGEP